MSFNLKRPKRIGEENEDDLIRFQEEFLKNQSVQPAATVVKKNKLTDVNDTTNNVQNKNSRPKQKVEINFESDQMVLASVLKDVVEKPLMLENGRFSSNEDLFKNIPLSQEVEKINVKELIANAPGDKKNKSLFAQNLEKKGKLKSYFALNQQYSFSNVKNNVTKSNLTQTNSLISCEGLGNVKEKEQIHRENMEKLSQMSPDEILQEQKKLIEHLDPKILAFIRKRNKNESDSQQPHQFGKDSTTEEKLTLDKEEILNDMPIKPNKKWLNMDKIEYEKLEWMIKSKNPLKKMGTNESASARFDFMGNLISPEEDVPVTKALHHHGNEPEAAGYTLDELFHLGRSQFNQQRVIALQTLGNILSKCHEGHYYQIVKAGVPDESQEDEIQEGNDDKNNLLNQLIEGGILFLLRCALDDQTESVINVSLLGIKNLLQPPEQETNLDFTFDWQKGHEMVCLHPFSKAFNDDDSMRSSYTVDKNLNVSERKELSEMKDDEYIQQDLVRGLFRMSLMERLFYILDKYKPSLTTNLIQHNIFQILFRIMRHSSELCFDFTEKYSNLLDLIANEFLPLFVSVENPNLKTHLTNTTNTLKLMRLISCAGPTIAYKMYTRYKLNEKIINYLTVDKYLNDSNLKNEVTKLQIETLRLLKIICIYNNPKMGIGCLIDSFEIILTKTKSITNDSNVDLNNNEDTIIHLQALISLFDNLILNLNEEDQYLSEKYQMCKTMFSLVNSYGIKLFNGSVKCPNQIVFSLLGICFNFLVDFLEKCSSFPSENKAEIITEKMNYLEELIEKIFIPVLNSEHNTLFDQIVMSKLSSFSALSTSSHIENDFKKIFTNNLSYLPTTLDLPAKDQNILKKYPFAFLSSFVRLYTLCFKLKMKRLDNKNFSLTHQFLNNQYLQSYLKMFIKDNNQSKESAKNSYLIMKYENLFVYYCLKLVFAVFNFENNDLSKIKNALSMKEEDSMETDEIYFHSKPKLDDKKFFYMVCLSLMTKFKRGDEHFINDLITSCLFDMNYWSIYLTMYEEPKSNSLTKYFEQLNLLDGRKKDVEFSYLNISSSQSELIKINENFLKNLESVQIYENLNQMKFTYIDDNYVTNLRLLEHSNRLNNIFKVSSVSTFKVDSTPKCLFLSNSYTNKLLLKPDWMFLPIIRLLKQHEFKQKTLDANNSETITSSRAISRITNCLKYIYLMEIYLDQYLESNVDITLRYVRLLYVYLFDNEIFLDKQIITFLYLIFFKYSNDKRNLLEKLNFNIKFDNIISFYDFYQYLLTHYDSTSFGNYLFSMYLIVPIQQCYPLKYRQLFYSDYSHLFKFIKFDTKHTNLLIPMKNFLHPNEKSLHLIRLYSQLILDQNDFNLICHSKLAYTIIVSHLNSFIFEHTNQVERKVEFEFKKLLVTHFMSLQNQKLKHDVINFKCFNNTTQVMEFYQDLPLLRKQWLNQLNA